jgi:hypothetical protein
MHNAVRRVLAAMRASTPLDTTPNARLISFRTDAAGVSMPAQLRIVYPTQMTLILQHQYRDLAVTPRTIAVTTSFKDVWETLLIPLNAITAFEDQTVHFKIEFHGVDPRQGSAATIGAALRKSVFPEERFRRPYRDLEPDRFGLNQSEM